MALSSSAEYVIDELALPVRNVLARVPSSEFLCPGGLVRIELGPAHPVTFGLPASLPAFLDGPLAFQPQGPNPAAACLMKVQVVRHGQVLATRTVAVPPLAAGQVSPPLFVLTTPHLHPRTGLDRPGRIDNRRSRL